MNVRGESVVGDEAAGERAEADSEVHDDALHRERGRAAGRPGVSPVMSVDCDGQKPPTPIPLTIATRNPCHGLVDERVARVADA